MLAPIRFADANFPKRLELRSSRLEGPSLRWTPFGMPRLNPLLESSVFFLYERDRGGNLRGPLGTGTFVGMPPKNMPPSVSRHIYAVTNQHVAPSGASIIRINTKGDSSRLIELEPHEWEFIPGGDDIAAVDVTDRLRGEEDEISFVATVMFANEEFIRKHHVSLGEDGFMLGLFAEQPGENRNMVAARFGNLSMLANPDAPIKQPNGSRLPCHIFDMRSRPGFSGSPVFVYRTPSGDLRKLTTERPYRMPPYMKERLEQMYPKKEIPYEEMQHREWRKQLDDDDNTFLAMLGIHAGQYPEKIVARKIAESDDVLHDGDKLQVPSSMTIVVPASRVRELLNLPTFVEQRMARETADNRRRAHRNDPLPETAEEGKAAPESDNPAHKEDFRRLLDAAAKTKQ